MLKFNFGVPRFNDDRNIPRYHVILISGTTSLLLRKKWYRVGVSYPSDPFFGPFSSESLFIISLLRLSNLFQSPGLLTLSYVLQTTMVSRFHNPPFLGSTAWDPTVFSLRVSSYIRVTWIRTTCIFTTTVPKSEYFVSNRVDARRLGERRTHYWPRPKTHPDSEVPGYLWLKWTNVYPTLIIDLNLSLFETYPNLKTAYFKLDSKKSTSQHQDLTSFSWSLLP